MAASIRQAGCLAGRLQRQSLGVRWILRRFFQPPLLFSSLWSFPLIPGSISFECPRTLVVVPENAFLPFFLHRYLTLDDSSTLPTSPLLSVASIR